MKSVNRRRIENKNPETVIQNAIKNWVNEGLNVGDKLTHKHNPKIEIELIEPTNKGWKVYQIEKGKKKIAYFNKQDISGDKSLFELVTPLKTDNKMKITELKNIIREEIQKLKESVINENFLHIVKRVLPDGDFIVDTYDGEAMSPKEAIQKMRISLNGYKAYKYKGLSSTMPEYKKWHSLRNNGNSPVETYKKMFKESVINENFIPKVGTIDDFMLKKLLLKNPKVKSLLSTKEMNFLKKPDTDVIQHESKPFNTIVTDGKLEFEIDGKKWVLVKPLKKARPEIISYYSKNESVNKINPLKKDNKMKIVELKRMIREIIKEEIESVNEYTFKEPVFPRNTVWFKIVGPNWNKMDKAQIRLNGLHDPSEGEYFKYEDNVTVSSWDTPYMTNTSMLLSYKKLDSSAPTPDVYIRDANKFLKKIGNPCRLYKSDYKHPSQTRSFKDKNRVQEVTELKRIIKEIIKEETEYQQFFKKALEKTGKSIPQMSDDEKKDFFNKIDKAWKGKGEKSESVSEGNVKLSSNTKHFWNTQPQELFGKKGAIYDTIPPSQWNTHPKVVDSIGKNNGAELFVSFIKRRINGKGHLDVGVAKTIGLPTNVSILDYLNDGGSGLNGNKNFKKYGNSPKLRFIGALYDIYEEMVKKFGKMKAESVNEAKYKVGDTITVIRKDGMKYKGTVEKLNPLKLRIDSTSTVVLPNPMIKKVVEESVNEALSVDPRKVYGGTGAKEGMVLTSQKGLMKILDLSKKNPSNVFLVSDDNYTNFGPFYVKNGKVAKYTVANPNYDLEKNKVRTVKVPSDVILKFKVVESVNEAKYDVSGFKKDSSWKKKMQQRSEFGNLLSPNDVKFLINPKADTFIKGNTLIITDGNRWMVFNISSPVTKVKRLGNAPDTVKGLVGK
jgi:hypothetical protein